MNEFINGIIRINGVQWMGFICIITILSIPIMLITALTADHKIRCYYMETEYNSSSVNYKIMGDVDWSQDVRVFTSMNPDKTIEVNSTLKQCVGE